MCVWSCRRGRESKTQGDEGTYTSLAQVDPKGVPPVRGRRLGVRARREAGARRLTRAVNLGWKGLYSKCGKGYAEVWRKRLRRVRVTINGCICRLQGKEIKRTCLARRSRNPQQPERAPPARRRHVAAAARGASGRGGRGRVLRAPVWLCALVTQGTSNKNNTQYCVTPRLPRCNCVPGHI